MISVQEIEKIEKYLGKKAISFLHELMGDIDLAKDQKGKWTYFEDEASSKCIILDESGELTDVMEFHKKYTDIHFTLVGSDLLLIGDEISETIQEYSLDGDYGLVKANIHKELVINQAYFVLIEPSIPHINMLEKESLKVVFKIEYSDV